MAGENTTAGTENGSLKWFVLIVAAVVIAITLTSVSKSIMRSRKRRMWGQGGTGNTPPVATTTGQASVAPDGSIITTLPVNTQVYQIPANGNTGITGAGQPVMNTDLIAMNLN